MEEETPKNVVKFRIASKPASEQHINAKAILERGLEDGLEDVLVLAWTEKGELYVSSSMNHSDNYWISGLYRRRLMDWGLGEDDES